MHQQRVIDRRACQRRLEADPIAELRRRLIVELVLELVLRPAEEGGIPRRLVDRLDESVDFLDAPRLLSGEHLEPGQVPGQRVIGPRAPCIA